MRHFRPLLISVVALGIAWSSLAACAGDEGRDAPKLDCTDSSAFPAALQPSAIRSPVSSADQERFEGLIGAWEASSYEANYEYCGAYEGETFSASLVLHKDGMTRVRIDEGLAIKDERVSITGIAVADSFGNRVARCSENLGAYYRAISGPAIELLAQDDPSSARLLDLKAACLDEPYADFKNIVGNASTSGLFPTESDRLDDTSYVSFVSIEKDAAGNTTSNTCVDYAVFFSPQRYCFDAVGRLVSAASSEGGRNARMVIVGTASESVDPGQFEPPFKVEPSTSCITATAWEEVQNLRDGTSEAREPATGPELFAANKDLLVRHFRSVYAARYRVCYSDFDSGSFSGIVTWQKGGLVKMRLDYSPDDGSPSVAYLIERDELPILCSDRLGDQLRPYIIFPDSSSSKERLKLQAACINDSTRLRGCVCYGIERDWYQPTQILNSLEIDIEDFEGGAGDNFIGPDTRKIVSHRRIFNRDATCYEWGRTQAEQCYDVEGVLLYARADDTLVEIDAMLDPPTADAFDLPYPMAR